MPGKKSPKRRETTTPNRVKFFREQRVWTRAKLARKADVAVGTINRMEVGRRTRKDRRLAVARAFGETYGDVFPNDTD